MRVAVFPLFLPRPCSPNPTGEGPRYAVEAPALNSARACPQRFHSEGPEIFSFRIVTSKQVSPGSAWAAAAWQLAGRLESLHAGTTMVYTLTYLCVSGWERRHTETLMVSVLRAPAAPEDIQADTLPKDRPHETASLNEEPR